MLGTRMVAGVMALTGLLHGRSSLAAPVVQSELERALESLRPSVRSELERSSALGLDGLPRYQLNLTLSDDLTIFTLSEEVTYTNTEATALPDLAFRVFANRTLEPAPITVGDAECEPGPCRTVRESPSAFRVIPKAPLARGASLRVRIELVGKLRVIAPGETDMMSQSMKGMASLFSAPAEATDYGLLSVGDGVACLANFHALVAARRKGKWVTSERTTMGDLGSDDLAVVNAWVTTAKDVTIATAGASKLQTQANGKRMYSVTGLVRDFALLASRSFVSVSRSAGDVTVTSHFVKGDEPAGMRVLDVATESLKIFESRFGQYPYREFDVVEAPVVGGAGGVEFSGLVTIANMFYRPSAGGLDQIMGLLGGGSGEDFKASALEFTTAHEAAHQYWHGLVGSDSREHAFVDESMAQWSTLLYLEDRYGAARAQSDAEQHVLMNYRMMRMLGQSDGAVDRPVDTFPSAIAYAGLVYGKGAYLYSALRKALGDGPYFEALRRYVNRYEFQVAPSTALFDELARTPQGAREVRRLTSRYLKQTHGDQDLGVATGKNASDPLSSLLGQLGGKNGGLGNLGNAQQLLQQLMQQAGDGLLQVPGGI